MKERVRAVYGFVIHIIIHLYKFTVLVNVFEIINMIYWTTTQSMYRNIQSIKAVNTSASNVLELLTLCDFYFNLGKLWAQQKLWSPLLVHSTHEYHIQSKDHHHHDDEFFQ